MTGTTNEQSSGLLYGPLDPLLIQNLEPSVEPRLIAVLELSDRQNGEVIETIEIDVSDVRLGKAELQILSNNGWTADFLIKYIEPFSRHDDAAAVALERARTSEHKWTDTRLDEESAIAWCKHKGIELN